MLLTICLPLILAADTSPPADAIRFNRDIRPILADKCFRCHGLDSASRKGDLRLDRREEALDRGAIRPGDRDASTLWQRITATDESRMPPADSGITLSAAQTEMLGKWLVAGAEYEAHWAFALPRQLPPPQVSRETPDAGRNPIDAWVLAGLRERGLRPSPRADRETLLRRLSLVLTGLPPSPAEMDQFQADSAPDVFERTIDRMLASPHYAERLTLEWLDAARYADTNGYFQDLERMAWPWRDWVWRSFQENKPFDQFTREQLAGDLLPNPTTDQRLATSFHRNHMVSNETGIIEEEYRVSYVADRVETTGTVWLGLTLGCARCHDHKYDPVSQADYFRLFAFFNSIDETGLVRGVGNPPPVLSLATPEQELQRQELRTRRTAVETKLRELEPALAEAESQWLETANLPTSPDEGLVAHFDFEGRVEDLGPRRFPVNAVGETTFSPAIRGQGANYDISQYHDFHGPELADDRPFSLAVWVKPGSAPVGYVLTKMEDTPSHRGLEVNWYKSMPRISLVNTWRRSAVEVQSADTVSGGTWHHLAITYDGSRRGAGIRMFLDGRPQATTVRRDDLYGPISTGAPWSIARKSDGLGWDGALDELRLYDRVLSPDDVHRLFWHDLLHGARLRAPAQRLPLQKEHLRTYFLAKAGSDEARSLQATTTELRRQEESLTQRLLSASVMQDISSPRDTFILTRGQYDQPGEKVTAGVPSALGQLSRPVSSTARHTRLDLANWLVARDNPLTARVVVNRFWQMVFGEGLVRSVNDFGIQGELPSHPELLDWLAVEFMETHWDVKRLLRLMVTSETFQQTSDLTPELLARDPENRWLARGPRYRLPGELLRDQALSLSGLLVTQVGGPSVRPYQPAGLWEAVSYNADQTYGEDAGAGLYRRSLYTFWKRQAPPPTLLTFDGPTRETCVVRRPRTNTPLQALVLLNDVTYVEAARVLATDILRTADFDDERAVPQAFRRVTGRLPRAEEVDRLHQFVRTQTATYRQRPADAARLIQLGASPAPPDLDPPRLAAWTLLVGVLVNLDETITVH